jgi:hypothetical protein
MILYIKDTPQKKKTHPKTPRHHEQLQQSSRTQIQLQKSAAFLYTNNEQIEK